MTRCVSGGDSHPFPVEDETGAHCPEHGVTLLWNPVYTNERFREDGAPHREPPQGAGQQLYAR